MRVWTIRSLCVFVPRKGANLSANCKAVFHINFSSLLEVLAHEAPSDKVGVLRNLVKVRQDADLAIYGNTRRVIMTVLRIDYYSSFYARHKWKPNNNKNGSQSRV